MKKRLNFVKAKPGVSESGNRNSSNGIVLIALIIVASLPFSATTSSATENELIFISTSDCNVCQGLKPFAKEAAETLGVKFVETEFSTPVPFPGYVLILDGTAHIVGFNSELVLFQSLCDLTQNDKACTRYDQLRSLNEQISG